MKKLIYLLLIALIAFALCDCANVDNQNVNTNKEATTTGTEEPINQDEVYLNVDNQNVDTNKEVAMTDTEKPINQDEVYLKIIDDIFRNFYGESSPNPVIEDGKLKVLSSKHDFRLKYNISRSSNGISLEIGAFQEPHYRPYKINIATYNESNYLVNVYGGGYHDNRGGTMHENILYDQYGNRITLSEQIRENESRLLSILEPITKIKNDDKAIFAAILSSKVMDNVDYIEYDDCLEVFCENKDASYRFLLKESKDSNGYWGIINKMNRSAELQNNNNDGSSEVYAFKISDKSTSTKRFMVSLVRVVQTDIGNEMNNKAKYGETSNTNHVVNDYVVASGVGLLTGGGVDILATNEDTFTKKYLSEVSENIIYTYENEKLKINGRSAYEGKVNKL